MPCRANLFGPMGMTSELLGAVLPIPPRGPSPMCKSLRTVPHSSPVQKAQNAIPHDQGALMAQHKKERARGPHGSRGKRNSRLREQRRSPETPPRAAIQNLWLDWARSQFRFFRPAATCTGSFCVFGPALSSPAHASPSLPMPQINRNRNSLDFMRWPHIDLGAQDLNDIQRPKSFQQNSWK
jgi:hypothetical protein